MKKNSLATIFALSLALAHTCVAQDSMKHRGEIKTQLKKTYTSLIRSAMQTLDASPISPCEAGDQAACTENLSSYASTLQTREQEMKELDQGLGEMGSFWKYWGLEKAGLNVMAAEQNLTQASDMINARKAEYQTLVALQNQVRLNIARDTKFICDIKLQLPTRWILDAELRNRVDEISCQ